MSRSLEARTSRPDPDAELGGIVMLNVCDQDDHQDEPRAGIAGEISAVATHANCIARPGADSRERRLRGPRGLTRPSRG